MTFRLLPVLVLTCVLVGGCAGLRAARLYDSGSDALHAGQADRALTDLEEAARLRPEVSGIRNQVGLAHLAAGDPEAARQAFEHALELDCSNAAARRNLSVVDGDAREEP